MFTKIRIFKLRDNIIINKDRFSEYYYAENGVFIISVHNLMLLLKFMLYKGLLSPKTIEGILSEYYDNTD